MLLMKSTLRLRLKSSCVATSFFVIAYQYSICSRCPRSGSISLLFQSGKSYYSNQILRCFLVLLYYSWVIDLPFHSFTYIFIVLLNILLFNCVTVLLYLVYRLFYFLKSSNFCGIVSYSHALLGIMVHVVILLQTFNLLFSNNKRFFFLDYDSKTALGNLFLFL